MNVSERAISKTTQTINRLDIQKNILFFDGSEVDIYRDRMKDIAGYGNKFVQLNAFPVQLNPSSKEKDKAGVKEHINAIFYVSKRDFANKIGDIPVDINRYRIAVVIDAKTYRFYNIDTANYYGNVATKEFYRYVVIACTEVL
jgi:hypothetical protein